MIQKMIFDRAVSSQILYFFNLCSRSQRIFSDKDMFPFIEVLFRAHFIVYMVSPAETK